jgi:ribosomal protein L30E
LLTLNFNEGADMKKLFILLAAMLTFTSTAFAFIGSLDADLVYTPVTPCRIFDSRTSQGGSGPVAAGGIKAFNVWGVSSYAGQGGSPTNCGIVAGGNTAAIAVSMAVVSPAGQGYLTAFPGNVADAAKPLAATLNYNAGEVVVSNAATLKVAQAGSPDLKIFSSNATEIIVDVVGYYSKPVATALECIDTALTSAAMTSGPITGLYYNTVTAPACSSGYTSTALYCNVDNVRGSANPWFAPGTSTCVGNSPTNTENVRAWQRCCRIPGR